jgi:pimeloyl-ACP methyl ester carboxylesterase
MDEFRAARKVAEITLDAAGIPLSALVAEPETSPPKAVVVAIHGIGMRAAYFDAKTVPGQSLLELGADLGWTVLAVDRPGYGRSAARFPDGAPIADQAEALWAGLDDFASKYPIGAGFAMVAHSFGGKVALAAAGLAPGTGLIGVDASGCGLRYAVEPTVGHDGRHWALDWGVLRYYPPGTFQQTRSLVTPIPDVELCDALAWETRFPRIAAGVDVPVRLTFAEAERRWSHGEQAVAELAALFRRTAVRIDRQPCAGHNISLGWAARAYHLRAFAFLEECLLARTANLSGTTPALYGNN